MKTLASIVVLLSLLGLPAPGEEAGTNTPVKIPASEAKQHLGANAVVTGKVVEVNKAEKLVRLNFEKPFPNQAFTAIIFATRTNLFPDIDQLKGKTVEVSGKIVEYRNRPEIQLNSTNQLKVIGQSSEPGKR